MPTQEGAKDAAIEQPQREAPVALARQVQPVAFKVRRALLPPERALSVLLLLLLAGLAVLAPTVLAGLAVLAPTAASRGVRAKLRVEPHAPLAAVARLDRARSAVRHSQRERARSTGEEGAPPPLLRMLALPRRRADADLI